MTARSAGRPPLDRELERRIAALESSGSDAAGTDFDAASWFWIALLGAVGPVALILWGWFG